MSKRLKKKFEKQAQASTKHKSRPRYAIGEKLQELNEQKKRIKKEREGTITGLFESGKIPKGLRVEYNPDTNTLEMGGYLQESLKVDCNVRLWGNIDISKGDIRIDVGKHNLEVSGFSAGAEFGRGLVRGEASGNNFLVRAENLCLRGSLCSPYGKSYIVFDVANEFKVKDGECFRTFEGEVCMFEKHRTRGLQIWGQGIIIGCKTFEAAENGKTGFGKGAHLFAQNANIDYIELEDGHIPKDPSMASVIYCDDLKYKDILHQVGSGRHSLRFVENGRGISILDKNASKGRAWVKKVFGNPKHLDEAGKFFIPKGSKHLKPLICEAQQRQVLNFEREMGLKPRGMAPK